MKLLIDGDIIAYKAATVAENPIDWGDGLWTLHAFEDDVKMYITDFISSLEDCVVHEIGYCSETLVFLSDRKNFRKDIAPFYKANRANTRRPMLLPFANAHMRKAYGATSMEGLEADDCLGIAANTYEDTVIWSEDKDLMTIQGYHLVDRGVVEVNAHQANQAFYTQVLTGDSADNYKGCPGIGAVKAKRLLEDKYTPVDMWVAVLNTYKKAGLSEDDAILQARLAYIKQEHSRELWTPPTEKE